MKKRSKTRPEDLAEPYVDGVQDDSVHPVTGEQSAEESDLLIIEFSKLDPEIRRGIVGELAPEETPEEREARLERCRIATTEYDAEFGPLTPEDKAWADAVLDRLGINADTCQGRRGRVGRRGGLLRGDEVATRDRRDLAPLARSMGVRVRSI